jgi:hypothetical protein
VGGGVNRPPLVCAGCGRRPAELVCYRVANMTEDGGKLYPSVDEYVWMEEGTLNRATGQFLCDDCYIAQGMPSNRAPGQNWTPPT